MASSNNNVKSFILAYQLTNGSIVVESSHSPGERIARLFSGVDRINATPYKVLGIKEESQDRTVETVTSYFKRQAQLVTA